jgi:hypothetical protein
VADDEDVGVAGDGGGDPALLGPGDEVIDQDAKAPPVLRLEVADDGREVVDAFQVLDDDADVPQVVAPDLLHQLRVVLALDVDAAGLGDLGPLLRRGHGAGGGPPPDISGIFRLRGRLDQRDPLAVKQERARQREHPPLAEPVLKRHQARLDRDHRTAETALEVLDDQVTLGLHSSANLPAPHPRNRSLPWLRLAVPRCENVAPVVSASHACLPGPDHDRCRKGNAASFSLAVQKLSGVNRIGTQGC